MTTVLRAVRWTGARFEYTENDEDGRLVGTGETFTVRADQVFKAIGQKFVSAAFAGSDAPQMSGNRIDVDENRRTSLPDVWAGGDCVPGQDLTVAAVQDGKVAALAMDRFLNN